MNHSVDDRQNINISEIASALGVSKTTVSRALSGKGRISAGTRERVKRYIEEHNYRPNVMSKRFADKTNNIALVLPAEFSKFEQLFGRESLSGVYQTAEKCDYNVVITITQPNDLTPVRRIVENKKVDGCVLFQAMENDTVISYLKEHRVPFVLMGSCEDKDIIQVDNTQKEACRELTGLLLLQEIGK